MGTKKWTFLFGIQSQGMQLTSLFDVPQAHSC